METTLASQFNKTVDEYFAWECRTEFKNEYRQGRILPMVDFTADHVLISTNLVCALSRQLKDTPYTAYISAMRVRVNDAHYTYPDGSVTRGKSQFQRNLETDTLLNPTLIVEVLLPATEAYDRGEKFFQYQGMESVQEYVLVSSHIPRVEQFVRQAGGKWLYRATQGLEQSVMFPTIDCRLPLAKIYRQVEL